MTLRHAVLAALLDGDASGYELAKRFDVGVANFWPATPQQLYRELERLEGDGLVGARLVVQERRPNKRVFRLTAAGRTELREFTARPVRPMTLRDDLVVKVQAIDAGDAEAVDRALDERWRRSKAKLDLYERVRVDLLAGRSEDEYLREADRVGPYLTLLGGRMLEQQNIRWVRTVRRILADRAAWRSGR